jgi:N-acetylneuraminic acid mutarotase
MSAAVGQYIYSFGGITDNYGTFTTTPHYNDLHRFNTETGVWTKLNPTGDIPPARGGGALAKIGGKLVLFGGGTYLFDEVFTHQFYNDIHVYDISENKWKKKTQSGLKPTARIFTAGDSLGGDFFVFGGIDDSFSRLNELWRYDLFSNSWTLVSNNGPVPRNDMLFMAGFLGFFVAGGETSLDGFQPIILNDTWVRNPLLGWTRIPGSDLPLPIGGMQYTKLNGVPVIFGGDAPAPDIIPPDFLPRKNIQDITYYFNIFHQEWMELDTDNSPPAAEFGCMEEVNGKAYLFLGYNIVDNTLNPNDITFTQTFHDHMWVLS